MLEEEEELIMCFDVGEYADCLQGIRLIDEE